MLKERGRYYFFEQKGRIFFRIFRNERFSCMCIYVLNNRSFWNIYISVAGPRNPSNSIKFTTIHVHPRKAKNRLQFKSRITLVNHYSLMLENRVSIVSATGGSWTCNFPHNLNGTFAKIRDARELPFNDVPLPRIFPKNTLCVFAPIFLKEIIIFINVIVFYKIIRNYYSFM